jgi:hypothetical protein
MEISKIELMIEFLDFQTDMKMEKQLVFIYLESNYKYSNRQEEIRDQ